MSEPMAQIDIFAFSLKLTFIISGETIVKLEYIISYESLHHRIRKNRRKALLKTKSYIINPSTEKLIAMDMKSC